MSFARRTNILAALVGVRLQRAEAGFFEPYVGAEAGRARLWTWAARAPVTGELNAELGIFTREAIAGYFGARMGSVDIRLTYMQLSRQRASDIHIATVRLGLHFEPFRQDASEKSE